MQGRGDGGQRTFALDARTKRFEDVGKIEWLELDILKSNKIDHWSQLNKIYEWALHLNGSALERKYLSSQILPMKKCQKKSKAID